MSPRTTARNGGSPTGSFTSSDEYGDEKINPLSLYGKPLDRCLAVDKNPIPAPIRKCIEYFRRDDNIKSEGIFRVPGSSNAGKY